MRIQLDKSERRSAMFALVVGFCALLVLSIVLFLYAPALNGDLSFRAIMLTLSYLLVSVSLVVFAFRLAFEAGSLGWYGSLFEVDSKCIVHVLPSGLRQHQSWEDLSHVSPRKRTLYFSDGTSIRLAFGPGQKGKFSDEAMQSLLREVPEDNDLSRALVEYRGSDHDRRVANIGRVLAAACYVIGSAITVWVYKSSRVDRGFWIIAALSTIAVTIFALLLTSVGRQIKVDRKFRQPHVRK